MLEFLGNAVISFIERELVEAAPEKEKALLQQVGGLVETLAEYLAVKPDAKHIEHE